MGGKAALALQFDEGCSQIFLAMINGLMKLATLGAGGAMAFTVGCYGIAALRPLPR